MIIGIAGLIGSGKDTIASHLVEKYGYERYSWASPLKDITATLFGWDRNMLEGATPEQRAAREVKDDWWSYRLEKNWTPRYGLQYMGTEVMRNALHEDIWVLAGMRRIADKQNVAIPDTRFPNEIAAIKELGGVIWNVRRGPNPEWYDALTKFKRAEDVSRPEQWLKVGPELVEWFMKENYPNVHASEYSWHGTEFDAVFQNNGTIDDLKATVDLVIGDQVGPFSVGHS